jgi:hypothetical protein
MPKDHDRDWVRFCLAVEGFRAKYGAWPTRMRLDPGYIEEFRRSLLSPADFEKLQARIELIAESEAPFIAEDQHGRTYSSGTEALQRERDDIDAQEWLGIEALPETW